MSIVYLDSSAFVKLIAPEAETGALRRYLRSHDHWLSASLLRAEVLRAALRSGNPQRLLALDTSSAMWLLSTSRVNCWSRPGWCTA